MLLASNVIGCETQPYPKQATLPAWLRGGLGRALL